MASAGTIVQLSPYDVICGARNAEHKKHSGNELLDVYTSATIQDEYKTQKHNRWVIVDRLFDLISETGDFVEYNKSAGSFILVDEDKAKSAIKRRLAPSRVERSPDDAKERAKDIMVGCEMDTEFDNSGSFSDCYDIASDKFVDVKQILIHDAFVSVPPVQNNQVKQPVQFIDLTVKSPRVLGVGVKVYAFHYEKEIFFPGVVISSVVKDASTVLYDIKFTDGKRGVGINGSFVKTHKEYLMNNVKKPFALGDEIFVSGLEDNDGHKVVTWHAGVIKNRILSFGNDSWGPCRDYEIDLVNGVNLKWVDECFVRDKEDHLLLIHGKGEKWKGVRNIINVFLPNIINDFLAQQRQEPSSQSSKQPWPEHPSLLSSQPTSRPSSQPSSQPSGEEYAGFWVVEPMDGQVMLFSRLFDALRAYDKNLVDSKGCKTEREDVNLPEEWAFPVPFGICPPVYIGNL